MTLEAYLRMVALLELVRIRTICDSCLLRKILAQEILNSSAIPAEQTNQDEVKYLLSKMSKKITLEIGGHYLTTGNGELNRARMAPFIKIWTDGVVEVTPSPSEKIWDCHWQKDVPTKVGYDRATVTTYTYVVTETGGTCRVVAGTPPAELGLQYGASELEKLGYFLGKKSPEEVIKVIREIKGYSMFAMTHTGGVANITAPGCKWNCGLTVEMAKAIYRSGLCDEGSGRCPRVRAHSSEWNGKENVPIPAPWE